MSTDKIMCADYVNNVEGDNCEKVADEWCLEQLHRASHQRLHSSRIRIHLQLYWCRRGS